MKIALGSTSEDKKKILEKVLLSFDILADIKSISVDSGITDQPLDEETTIKGAVNRAIQALDKSEKVDISIGLEGGLVKVFGERYYLVCAAAILDKNKTPHIGLSSKLKIPQGVSENIGQGGSFGIEIRQYLEKYAGNDGVEKYIKLLISREVAFFEAIRNAYISYINKDH